MIARRITYGFAAALFVFALNAFFQSTTYLYGCTVYGGGECSVSGGFYWIRHHPVFPLLIWAMPMLGFVFGVIFGFGFTGKRDETESTPSPLNNVLALLLAVPLITAFALWGVPEIAALLWKK